MKHRLTALLIGLLVLPAYARSKEEKPKVHADFQFGSYPTSASAAELMKSEQARLIVVGYHEGWSIDKIAKTFKMSPSDLARVSDKLEDERLVGRRDEFEIRPSIPVIRERDFDRVKDGLQRHIQDFTALLENHWAEISDMVGDLDGSKSLPRDRVMYETVVSGMLLGGMVDALWEDKTLLPPPPPRGKNGNDRYYAWLVESNPAAAGKLKRDLRESAGYRIITIGSELPTERLNADDLEGKATVYEDADARKYRSFISVFTRDKLLPFFKSHRDDFLKQAALVSAGKYASFGEFFGWYYDAMVNGTVDKLAADHRIAPPSTYYTYAIRAPR